MFEFRTRSIRLTLSRMKFIQYFPVIGSNKKIMSGVEKKFETTPSMISDVKAVKLYVSHASLFAYRVRGSSVRFFIIKGR